MGSPTMAVNLPFKPEALDSNIDFYRDIESSALYKMLPANAKEYVKASPHLLEYLHGFPGQYLWHPPVHLRAEKRPAHHEKPQHHLPGERYDVCPYPPGPG